MKTKHKTMKAFILTALTALTPAVLPAATLIGDTVQIRREIASQSIVTGPFSTVVVEGSSDSVSVSSSNNLSINPESTIIIFNLGPNSGSGGGILDHFLIVSDINWFGEPALKIQSISTTSDIAGFSPDFVTFTDDSISLAIGSFNWSGGQSVQVQVTPTPEPTTGLLITLGMGVLLCRRRCQKA